MRGKIPVVLSAVLLLGLLLTAGCRATKISDILDNFSQYEGKRVTIVGTVGDTIWLGIAERGAFQVGDGSGTIWVVTSRPPPQTGDDVTVTGTAQAAFTLGETSLGEVIMESERR